MVKIPDMKCIIKERLNQMNLSVRKLAEQGKDKYENAPSYSTIDNFIRNGTGTVNTAWSITKMMEISLSEAFIAEGEDIQPLRTVNADTVPKGIVEKIIDKEKITTVADIADILYDIGIAIRAIGHEEKAADIIRLAKKAVSSKESGGESYE